MAFRFRVGPFCIGDPGSAYNGFSWEARCAVTPLQKAAARRGDIVRPPVCGITGYSKPSDPTGAGYIFQHIEDYSRPLEFYAVARHVHAALHARFTDPLTWFAIVRAHYVHGSWFTFLSMDPADMVRPFREVYPLGLPAEGVVWGGLASSLGLEPKRFPGAVEAAGESIRAYNLFRQAGREVAR